MPDRGFVISFTDVTDERKSAQALVEAKELLEQRVASRTMELADALSDAERANASKSRFVAAASHDLLQPLSAAKLYVSTLGSGLDAAEAHAVATKAESALNSVEHILEALLDISKLDSGRASVHLSAIPVAELFSQMEDAFGPVAQAKGLGLRFVSTSAMVRSDASYLRRILQNLLSNAIRYTDHGKVLVGVRHKGRNLLIQVWDTGVGIASDQRDVVFQEFKRLHSDASAAEGMGLGLAIVERACGLLNHPILLHSELGQGTGFSVEVPTVGPKLAEQTEGALVARACPDALQRTVALLIESDDNLRSALCMMMETWGVQVLETVSREEASSLLKEIGILPDVIVADEQLAEGQTGTQAIAQLAHEFGRLPGCIISADRSTALEQFCKAAGFPLLHKPIDVQRFQICAGGLGSLTLTALASLRKVAAYQPSASSAEHKTVVPRDSADWQCAPRVRPECIPCAVDSHARSPAPPPLVPCSRSHRWPSRDEQNRRLPLRGARYWSPRRTVPRSRPVLRVRLLRPEGT